MNLGVICCLAINSGGGGDEEGDSSRWARVALPPSARAAGEDGMAWGEGDNRQLSTQIPGAVDACECLQTHEEPAWVNSRLKCIDTVLQMSLLGLQYSEKFTKKSERRGAKMTPTLRCREEMVVTRSGVCCSLALCWGLWQR